MAQVPPGSLATRQGRRRHVKLKSIRNSHAYSLLVCQLVVVFDDGQQIDRVADTVTLQFRVSYSAVSYLFGALEHRFLRQFS